MASSDAWRGIKISSRGKDGCLDMVEESGGVGNVGCGLGMSPSFCLEHVYSQEKGLTQCLKIDETAQKNTVLTVYELIHGDATISQGMYVSLNCSYQRTNNDFYRVP
jgi:hypothetical protein